MRMSPPDAWCWNKKRSNPCKNKLQFRFLFALLWYAFAAAAAAAWSFPMLIREILLLDFESEMESTRKLLEALPEKFSDFKPHPKSMALDRLAGHVAQLPAWVETTVATDGLDLDMSTFVPYTPTTRKEVLDEFDKSVVKARAAIASASDEHLGKTWTFSMQGKPVFSQPRTIVLRSTVLNHLIHHRAQLGVYLRLQEIAIPGMYGPSADDMAAFAAA
jgi:uncharacterized damage-inducible protein DinB